MKILRLKLKYYDLMYQMTKRDRYMFKARDTLCKLFKKGNETKVTKVTPKKGARV